MDEKFKQVESIVKKYNQEQLLNIYNTLTDEKQKRELLDDILTIDFKQVEKLYEESQNHDYITLNMSNK